MKHLRMRGWNVGVRKSARLTEPDGQGVMSSEPVWIITFVEAIPPTGDTIQFEVEEEVKNELVKALTGVEIATDIA